MSRKIIGIFIVILFVLTAFFGIFKMVSKELVTNNKPILFVPKTIDGDFEFWQVMDQGVFAAAKEYGVKVQVVGTNTETDIDGQIRLLEKALSDKPKGIILAATDYNRLIPIARKIKDAGITLITVDSGINGGISSSFIATNNYEAGIKAGESLRKWVAPDSTIAIISFVKGSATAIERESGVRDNLQDGGYTVLDTYYSNGFQDKAYEIATNLLLTKPEIKGIISLNEPSTVGAAKAVQDLGANSRVKLIGFDNSMDEIAFLEDGILQAIVVQKPFNMGYLAVKTALQVYNGEKVSSRIDTGSEVITKENMYTSENQKLLFPFVER